MSWVAMRMVMPRPSRRLASSSSRALTPWGSSPAVGSSRISTSGSMTSTPAMATRFFCPKERAWVGLSRRWDTPVRSIAASTRRRTSASGRPRLTAPKEISRYTSAEKSWSSGSWNTMPTRRRSSVRPFRSRFTGAPSSRISPADGWSTPLRFRNRVDLPAPLAPRMPVILPRSARRLMPFSAAVPSS